MTPPPVRLTRTTPRMAIRPGRNGRFVGLCQERGCGWRTPEQPTAGIISSIAAAHGLVLDDTPTPGIPVCCSVLRVAS